MQQTIMLDLKKQPELADILADKQPGDEVCLYGTIKHLDEQTATITVSEIEDHSKEDAEAPGGNEGSADSSYDKSDTKGRPPTDSLRDFSGGEMASM